MASKKICYLPFLAVLIIGFCWNLSSGHGGHESSASLVQEEVRSHSHAHHQCGNEHNNHQHHHRDHHHDHYDDGTADMGVRKLPEELAEEEDLKLFGFGSPHEHKHEHEHEGYGNASGLSGLGLWIHAMSCSLLVSLASLICLIILPLIFLQGKPSKTVVDTLAVFGAGAMLGDAFLHQLPHAFGGEHSHDHHMDHVGHSHSLKDLSVGLSILAGIIIFLLVEKLVRYVEGISGGHNAWGHTHHHHHSKNSRKLKDDSDAHENLKVPSVSEKDVPKIPSDEEELDAVSAKSLNDEKEPEPSVLRKRNTAAISKADEHNLDTANGSVENIESMTDKKAAHSSSSLVFGYLNLFSDGVHNFTDGMALGSAFLLYGSVGGWSRTLFLLAHELPQEIGDFGILVRSGFSVSEALFFNFLSALVALVGTGLALIWGQDPGHSSIIEGFTAGGFIYIAVAGVLAEMNNNGRTSLRSTTIQLASLIMGIAVALVISLVE